MDSFLSAISKWSSPMSYKHVYTHIYIHIHKMLIEERGTFSTPIQACHSQTHVKNFSYLPSDLAVSKQLQ